MALGEVFNQDPSPNYPMRGFLEPSAAIRSPAYMSDTAQKRQ